MCNLFWLKQKLPEVNKELALKLMEEGDDEAELASRKKKGKVGEQFTKSRRLHFHFSGLWIHLVWRYCLYHSNIP